MNRYTDEYLEYWGRMYELTPGLKAAGIKFIVFLEKPLRYLHTAFLIEQFKKIYLRNPAIRNQGVNQRAFMRFPDEMLRICIFNRKVMPELPQHRQRSFAERLEQQLIDDDMEYRNGTFTQPLHHHSYKHSRERVIKRH